MFSQSAILAITIFLPIPVLSSPYTNDSVKQILCYNESTWFVVDLASVGVPKSDLNITSGIMATSSSCLTYPLKIEDDSTLHLSVYLEGLSQEGGLQLLVYEGGYIPTLRYMYHKSVVATEPGWHRIVLEIEGTFQGYLTLLGFSYNRDFKQDLIVVDSLCVCPTQIYCGRSEDIILSFTPDETVIPVIANNNVKSDKHDKPRPELKVQTLDEVKTNVSEIVNKRAKIRREDHILTSTTTTTTNKYDDDTDDDDYTYNDVTLNRTNNASATNSSAEITETSEENGETSEEIAEPITPPVMSGSFTVLIIVVIVIVCGAVLGMSVYGAYQLGLRRGQTAPAMRFEEETEIPSIIPRVRPQPVDKRR